MRNSTIRFVLALGIVLSSACAALAADPSPCKPGIQTPNAVKNANVAITLDPKTSWQPRGGTIDFTITVSGPGTSPKDIAVEVCFGWSRDKLIQSAQVSLVSVPTTTSAVYRAVIPRSLPSAPWPQEEKPPVAQPAQPPAAQQEKLPTAGAGNPPNLEGTPAVAPRTALWMVPLATMRVAATGGAATPDVSADFEVGITMPGVALTLAALAVVIALAFFYVVGRRRGVGLFGIPLWMISNRNGEASLSQAQIMLWTFLIVASAIYVMALTGVLIDISYGTLGLLGISGLALLGAKIQKNKDDGQTPGALAVPGPVIGVAQVGPAAFNQVRLAWMPPVSGGPVSHYVVQYQVAGATTWTTVAATITRPHHTVLGLAALTTYNFQVLAANAGGWGTPVQLQGIGTPAVPPVPPGAPAPVGGLFVSGAPTLDTVQLAWSAPAGGPPGSYVVQWRRNDTMDAWTKINAPGNPGYVVSGLGSGVTYDFQVAAANGNDEGPSSNVVTASTLRKPKWSDLIVDGDGHGVIDVSRAQMLLFTLVTALFVAINVISYFTIPTIPTEVLVLMGISNGVYLTAKYIPD